MVLVFGIIGLVGSLGLFCCIGFVLCVVFAILAWVFGSGDLKKMRAGLMDRTGEGLTRAGMIMGIIGVCLAVLGLAIWVALVVFFGFAGFASSGHHSTSFIR